MNNIFYWNEKPEDFNGSLRASVLVVKCNEKYLLARKSKGEKFSGSWGLFGGKLETDETPRNAAVREFYEEAGVTYNSSEVAHLADIYYTLPEIHYTLHVYIISVQQKPDITLSREHDKYEWLTAEEIKSLHPIMPGVVMIVETFNAES